MTTMLMRNRANNITSRVAKTLKPRSVFPLGKSRKQTMNCSLLVPIFCEEVLPSDTWNIKMNSFIRLSTQITAPMDNLITKTYFFYVPRRLVHENFTKQIGEHIGLEEQTDVLTPQINSGENGFEVNSIYDYLGMPTGVPNLDVDATLLRAYNLIVNEYFLDTDAQNPLTVKTDDSDDNAADYTLFRKAKMRDYFTNATKDLQKGEPVQLPLGTTAPVIGNGLAIGLTDGTNNAGLLSGNSAVSGGPLYARQGTYNNLVGTTGGSNNLSDNVALGLTTDGEKSGLIANLSEAMGATVTALRQMLMTQVLLENDNRWGVRYTEIMQSRYGSLIPDLRIMRPQYLGGTASPMFTNPVIQTSGTGISSQDTPQGNIAGYGTNSDGGRVIRQSFGEFGWIIGLACVQAVPQYQQGLHKKFSRKERFDFYHPEFEGLSDQAIYNKEIYAQGGNVINQNTGEAIDDEVFGYIGRFDELRYFNNEICGEMRSTYTQTLDSWHYAEKFDELPVYNGNFIEDKTDSIVARSLAYQYEDVENEVLAPQLICDYEFKGQIYRTLSSKPVPMFGRSM